MNKSGFCPIPWIHSMLNLDGGYWMCCLANEQKSKISPPEAAFKYPHKNYRNSDTLKEVRSSMIKGILPDTCEGCKLDEKLGNRSKRISTLEQYPEVAKEAMLKTKLDGEIDIKDFPIRYRDHRFGRKCNLRCTICSKWASDQWEPEANVFWGDNKPFLFRSDFENSIYFKEITDYDNDDLDRLYFAGGEPLLHKAHHLYLEYLIHSKKSKNIIIEYNTNLLSLSDKILELWKHFKRIEVYISLEGIKEYYEFLRYPGKWHVLEKNIQKLQTLNIMHEFMVVVNIYNILHIIDMIKWFKDKVIYPRFLYNPFYLDARNVLNKKSIIQQWKTFLKNHTHKEHYMPIVNFLEQDVNYDYNEFIHFDQMLCKSRNLDSKKLFKHL